MLQWKVGVDVQFIICFGTLCFCKSMYDKKKKHPPPLLSPPPPSSFPYVGAAGVSLSRGSPVENDVIMPVRTKYILQCTPNL